MLGLVVLVDDWPAFGVCIWSYTWLPKNRVYAALGKDFFVGSIGISIGTIPSSEILPHSPLGSLKHWETLGGDLLTIKKLKHYCG